MKIYSDEFKNAMINAYAINKSEIDMQITKEGLYLVASSPNNRGVFKCSINDEDEDIQEVMIYGIEPLKSRKYIDNVLRVTIYDEEMLLEGKNTTITLKFERRVDTNV